MKKLIIFLLVLTSIQGMSQKVSVDKNGNYHPIVKIADINTGKTYTDDSGHVFTVYANSKNKLYIIRKSKKTGKEYKSYFKIN